MCLVSNLPSTLGLLKKANDDHEEAEDINHVDYFIDEMVIDEVRNEPSNGCAMKPPTNRTEQGGQVKDLLDEMITDEVIWKVDKEPVMEKHISGFQNLNPAGELIDEIMTEQGMDVADGEALMRPRTLTANADGGRDLDDTTSFHFWSQSCNEDSSERLTMDTSRQSELEYEVQPISEAAGAEINLTFRRETPFQVPVQYNFGSSLRGWHQTSRPAVVSFETNGRGARPGEMNKHGGSGSILRTAASQTSEPLELRDTELSIQQPQFMDEQSFKECLQDAVEQFYSVAYKLFYMARPTFINCHLASEQICRERYLPEDRKLDESIVTRDDVIDAIESEMKEGHFTREHLRRPAFMEYLTASFLRTLKLVSICPWCDSLFKAGPAFSKHFIRRCQHIMCP